MTRKGIIDTLVTATLAFFSVPVETADFEMVTLPATADALLNLDARPVAIAHRGFCDNLGENPTRPIENTIEAVAAAYLAGASVVEVDAQLTRGGEVAVFHDDVLPDFTCLNQLTLSELQDRLPHVPSLDAVLHEARKFNDSASPLSGLVIVELKPAAPFADPADTQDDAIVSAVVGVVRRMGMARQVLLASLSPALLALAHAQAPEIARILTVSGLQFLTAAQIEAQLGLTVRPISKTLDVGLRWAELGKIFRLPGYRSVDELLATAVATQVRAVEADQFLLSSGKAGFVEAVHAAGFKAFGFTATTARQWSFLERLGLDGIYTNDVRFAVGRQARTPAFHRPGQAR